MIQGFLQYFRYSSILTWSHTKLFTARYHHAVHHHEMLKLRLSCSIHVGNQQQNTSAALEYGYKPGTNDCELIALDITLPRSLSTVCQTSPYHVTSDCQWLARLIQGSLIPLAGSLDMANVFRKRLHILSAWSAIVVEDYMVHEISRDRVAHFIYLLGQRESIIKLFRSCQKFSTW